MKLISHRGNLNGKDEVNENNPVYVIFALTQGFDVEIDVWYVNNNFYLGHDEPKYLVGEEFLENESLWCHAKNVEALSNMLKNKKIHCFWHQTDDVTVTSKGYIWTFPNKELTVHSICLLPEIGNQAIPEHITGVCSDYIQNYK